MNSETEELRYAELTKISTIKTNLKIVHMENGSVYVQTSKKMAKVYRIIRFCIKK